MRWIDRLERHFGFLAIPHLMLAVILGQVLSTFLGLQDPTVPMQLMLDPAAVAQGQWWRLITWVIVPSLSRLNVVLAIFWFYFLWSIGAALESEWGTFKTTLYILLGVFLPAAGAMGLWLLLGAPVLLTGSYFSITMLLAYAALAPDQVLYVMMILPLKMRWVAWLTGAWLFWTAVTGGVAGAVEVVFGVGNYLLYFLPAGYEAWQLRRLAAEGRKVFVEAKRDAAVLQTRACHQCGAGAEADLRLCTCPACGEDGKFWCAQHLPGHLAAVRAAQAAADPPEPAPKPLSPKKKGGAAKPRKKRKG